MSKPFTNCNAINMRFVQEYNKKCTGLCLYPLDFEDLLRWTISFLCVSKDVFQLTEKKIEISDEENRLCVSSALFGLMSLLVFVTTLHKLFEYC